MIFCNFCIFVAFFGAIVCIFFAFLCFFSRFLFRVCCERPCWAVPRCSLPFLYNYCDLPVLIATKKWRYFTKFRASPLGRTSMFFILFTFAHKKRFFFQFDFFVRSNTKLAQGQLRFVLHLLRPRNASISSCLRRPRWAVLWCSVNFVRALIFFVSIQKSPCLVLFSYWDPLLVGA